MKKILSIITIIVIMLNMMGLSVFANTVEVELTGEIMSTVIDVDIPTAASFNINPNLPEGNPGRYIMPSLNITNNTTAPITVTMTDFDNKEGTANQFTEVARSSKVWDRLGTTESSTYIYLGFIAAENQTAFLNHSALLSEATADQVQQENKELCNIKAGGTIKLDLECQSGSAFPNQVTSVYKMIFVVSLYQGLEEIQIPEEQTPELVIPTVTGITSIVIDGVPSQLDFTKSAVYYIDKTFPYSSEFKITTSSDAISYVVNYKTYTGNRTFNVDNVDWSTPGAYYAELKHTYNGTPVTIIYVFY